MSIIDCNKSIDKAILVMPMVGMGARFSEHNFKEPKPLIDLHGRPFFWWASQSVLREVTISELVFIIKKYDVEYFSLDKEIKRYYPNAKIILLNEITSGAAETVFIGLKKAKINGSLIINDCDHLFEAPGLMRRLEQINQDSLGALSTFESDSKNYSYAKFSSAGILESTKEKEVISHSAIAGCYYFRDAQIYQDAYLEYIKDCPYSELYISGIYNKIKDKGNVKNITLDSHLSFGTPSELDKVCDLDFSQYLMWKDISR